MKVKKTRVPKAVYSTESQLRHPAVLLRGMWEDLKASRELAWRLFIRNISAQYRQTLLGYLWAFIPPVFTTLVFVFLTRSKILTVGDTGIPYPAYVMIGTVLWYVFLESVNSPVKLVSTSRFMLTKIHFPREALVLAALGEVVFNFFIRVVLLIFVFLLYKVPVSSLILLTPLGIFSLMLLGLLFGVILSPVALLYQDIEKGLPIIMQIWFFITPVIYFVPKGGVGKILNYINPVSPLLNTSREMLTTGVLSQTAMFIVISSITLVLIFLGWILFRIAMPHLIARIGS